MALALGATLFVCAGCQLGAADPTPADRQPLVSSKASYTLGPGDKLRVITFGELNLTGEFIVDDAGKIAFPLLGEVQTGGKTTNQVTADITTRLGKGYILNPKVSVEVLTYRPFYILGEVTRPGEYPFIAGLTVLNAVATAGGFTYRANTHKVLLHGSDDATDHTLRVTSGLRVHPGDTIRVLERHF